MIQVKVETLEALGGVDAAQARVIAHTAALAAHPFTVDQPAPVEEGIIDQIARAGGWANVEVMNDTAVANGLPMHGPLEVFKLLAQARVDMQAEQVRLRYITPGNGQSLEYQATEREAFLWQEGHALESYPFLMAEADAIEEATGVRPSDGDVVEQVRANALSWGIVGARIKQTRRSRKMTIGLAETKEQVLAILELPWSVT